MKRKLDWPAKGKIITKFGKQINTTLNTVTENIGINIETNKKYDEKRRSDADAKHKEEELDKPTTRYTDKELDAPGASNLTSIRKITPLGAFISA